MHDREIEQVVATRRPIRGEVPSMGPMVVGFTTTSSFQSLTGTARLSPWPGRDS